MHDLVRIQSTSQRFFVRDGDFSWGTDAAHWRGRPPAGLLEFYKELPQELPEHGVFAFRGIDGREVAAHATRLGCAVYVDDEIDKAGRKEGFDNSALRDIVNEGSHILSPDESAIHSVHILGAARRPQKLHNDLSEMADEVFIFRINGSQTLQRLEGDNHLEPQERERIVTLPKFHFKRWRNGETDWKAIPPL